jgi:SAM-dependent methyltransferase
LSSAATTERTRHFYERDAAKYDRRIGFFERLLFGGGREWVCGQAEGKVLEIALGTGRNLPFYAQDVRLTGVALSPAMLEIARRRAEELGREADLRVGDVELPVRLRTVAATGEVVQEVLAVTT